MIEKILNPRITENGQGEARLEYYPLTTADLNQRP